MSLPLNTLLLSEKVSEMNLVHQRILDRAVKSEKRIGQTKKVKSHMHNRDTWVSETPLPYSLGQRRNNKPSMERLEMATCSVGMVYKSLCR